MPRLWELHSPSSQLVGEPGAPPLPQMLVSQAAHWSITEAHGPPKSSCSGTDGPCSCKRHTYLCCGLCCRRAAARVAFWGWKYSCALPGAAWCTRSCPGDSTGHSQAGTARHLCNSWLCQALLSLSAIPGISQGTATAWRGFGCSVSCCFPACCCPPLWRARLPPALTGVCRQTPRRHHPSTMLPGEGTPGPGCFAARAVLAPQRALAPTRSSLLCFAFCPPQGHTGAESQQCPGGAAPAAPLCSLLRTTRPALLLPPVPAPASNQHDHPER